MEGVKRVFDQCILLDNHHCDSMIRFLHAAATEVLAVLPDTRQEAYVHNFDSGKSISEEEGLHGD